ncbi:hypothetical protein B0H14DRAFT_2600062 [Mycena olivaceomarginata]|nr:hypothetical protein B0H14DRAFT_2600062 [Mycena olivaceomarginata]
MPRRGTEAGERGWDVRIKGKLPRSRSYGEGNRNECRGEERKRESAGGTCELRGSCRGPGRMGKGLQTQLPRLYGERLDVTQNGSHQLRNRNFFLGEYFLDVIKCQIRTNARGAPPRGPKRRPVGLQHTLMVLANLLASANFFWLYFIAMAQTLHTTLTAVVVFLRTELAILVASTAQATHSESETTPSVPAGQTQQEEATYEMVSPVAPDDGVVSAPANAVEMSTLRARRIQPGAGSEDE